jgi:hypothetical protein
MQMELFGWNQEKRSKALRECGDCSNVGCQCGSESVHKARILEGDVDLLKQLCLKDLSVTGDAFIIWRRMDFFIVDSHTTVSALMEFLAECEKSGNNLFGRCMACKGPPVEGTLLRCGNCSKTLGACCAGAEKYSEDTRTLECPMCKEITFSLPTVRFMCPQLCINKSPLIAQQIGLTGVSNEEAAACSNSSGIDVASMMLQITPKCQQCGKIGVKLKCPCGLGIFYCDARCQRRGWSEHKKRCMTREENWLNINFSGLMHGSIKSIPQHFLFDQLRLNPEIEWIQCVLAMNRAIAHARKWDFKYDPEKSTNPGAATGFTAASSMSKDEEAILANMVRRGLATVTLSTGELNSASTARASELMAKHNSRAHEKQPRADETRGPSKN